MTALNQFVRLEAPALWQSDEGAQRRDVVVSFGDATLIIIDNNEVAQAHWSLAAVERLNPGLRPALFAPGVDAPERLEISDPDMIEAIEKVRKAVTGAGSRPGRLRRGIILGVSALILAGLIFWLPPALSAYTSRIAPQATRAAIGRDLAHELTRLTGQPCQTPDGTRALRLLAGRLFPGEPVTLAIYRDGFANALALPGGVILINRTLVEGQDTPEVVAGYIIAARVATKERDPLRELLDFAGPLASVRIMTSGATPPSALPDYAEHILQTSPAAADSTAVSEAIQASGVPIGPYAATMPSDMAASLVEGGETSADALRPVLNAANWRALSEICGT